MPIDPVVTHTDVSSTWGNDVASTINGLETADAAHVAAADPHTGYQRESEKGAVNGYAGLDAGGKVPAAQLPAAGAGTPPTVNVYGAGSGNWAKPAGALWVRVRMVGGGGSGGASGSTSAGEGAAASGGGAGGYVEKVFAASALSATEAYVCGAGGSAPAAGNNAGNIGGNSTFKGMTASAGAGGLGAAANATGPKVAGGQGGNAAGGDLNSPGGDGATSALNVGVVVAMGDGGASTLGTGAKSGNNAAGSTGHAYGGGGSGATNSANQVARAGGAGAAGVVIVETHFA